MRVSNDYHFTSHWHLKSTAQEVSEILEEPLEFVRWWPAVYLGIRELTGSKENGEKTYSLHTKGWLPYTLHWQSRRTESRSPFGYSIKAWGDLSGTGKWIFEQDGGQVKITYHWKVNANKPILRYLAFIMKPLFAANHYWAMRTGEESLKLEILRRKHAAEKCPDPVNGPPRPTFSRSTLKT